jgi:hypothetical protein
MRLLALSLFPECKNRTLVAEQLKISRTSVLTWVSQYLAPDLEGLTDDIADDFYNLTIL